MSPVGTCWFCGHSGIRLTKEHLIPKDWGGTLTARSCEACNRSASKFEKELASRPTLMKALGHSGIRRSGGGVHKATYPIDLYDSGDGRLTWTPSGLTVTRNETGNPVVPSEGKPIGEFSWGLGPPNVLLWARLASKVAIGCASLTVDEAWLSTPGASELRALLQRGQIPLGRSLAIEPVMADDDLPFPMSKDEHLILLQSSQDRDERELVIVLFGSLLYAIPIADLPAPSSSEGWLISRRRPSGPQPKQLSELAITGP